MPKFEMLIGEDPQKNTGSNKNPYKNTEGPLVAATIYRKYEFSQEISTSDNKVEKTNTKPNMFGKKLFIIDLV